MPYNLRLLRPAYSPPVWREIEEAPGYKISSDGHVVNADGEHLKAFFENHRGPEGRTTPYFTLWRQSKPLNRSVRVLLLDTFPELYRKYLPSEIDQYTTTAVRWHTIPEAPRYEISNKGVVRNRDTLRELKLRPGKSTWPSVQVYAGKTGTDKIFNRSLLALLQESFPDIYVTD